MTTNEQINDGGAAFPEHHYFDEGRGEYGQHMTASDVGCGGMTLRDYFAGQALPSIINAQVTQYRELCAMGKMNGCDYPIAWDSLKSTTESAYFVADAMIAARKEKP